MAHNQAIADGSVAVRAMRVDLIARFNFESAHGVRVGLWGYRHPWIVWSIGRISIVMESDDPDCVTLRNQVHKSLRGQLQYFQPGQAAGAGGIRPAARLI